MLLNPAARLENELDTHLTARVIDRLRLRAVHARKIRCTNKETLPQAPTTERLLRVALLQGNCSRPGRFRSAQCSWGRPELPSSGHISGHAQSDRGRAQFRPRRRVTLIAHILVEPHVGWFGPSHVSTRQRQATAPGQMRGEVVGT